MPNQVTAESNERFYFLVVLAVVFLYAASTIGVSLTKSPEIDEGWFASPALNMVTRGSMGTTVLEPSGTLTSRLAGINQHTYWVMPLHLLAQAGWYEVFGFSLFSMRTLSIAWGLVALASWFLIMKAISGNLRLAAMAFAFIALDYVFIMHASLGRMDMMCAALGFAAFAAYLCVRERSFTLSVLASQTLVAASLFTHPNGVMAFAGLFFLTLYFDRARVRLKHALLAAMPYVVGAASWGLYALQSPSSFAGQFSDQAAGRAPGLSAPLTALKEEFTRKYFEAFGLAPFSTGASRLKILILVAYAAAIVGAVCVRAIRRHRGFKALLILTAIYFVFETFFNHKLVFYLVHIIPMYAAILAVWVHWCWAERRVPRQVIAVAVCGFLFLQISGVVYRVNQNSYQEDYLPAVAFLKHHSGDKTLVIGSAEIAFGVGFERVKDDIRFGYYSGKTPDYIVMGYHYDGLMKLLEEREPAVYETAAERLSHSYKQVYNHGSYQIYALDKETVAALPTWKTARRNY
jgi:4-amino-4-deoxy-L-arabinose transferase-like glycosyltransferase